MEKNIATYRKDWLDSLRAVAIMLVVFGHQVPWAESYFAYTSPVKIPLFFAISGYLFKVRDGKFSTFAVNLFKKLIFPCLLSLQSCLFHLLEKMCLSIIVMES